MKHINRNQNIINALAELLQTHRKIGEYELMTLLDEQYGALFPKPDLSQSLLLFQHHFYLRHCLYTLQSQWLADDVAFLDIQLTHLEVLPMGDASNALGRVNELREYYSDLRNINKESSASVDALLDSFWQQFTQHIAAPRAHEVLQLTGHETYAEKKRRYKQLAQQHHPDKGGDAATFKQIQEAWQCVNSKH